MDIVDRPIEYNAQIMISRDGTRVVFCADGNVCAWDLLDGTTRYKQIGDFECTSMVFDADERRIILGSLFGSCLVWSLDDASGLMATEPAGGAILDIALTADGSCAITAAGDDTIHIWELGLGRVRMHMNGSVGKVDALAVSPNGEFAYSIYHDTLMAYDLGRSTRLVALSFDHQITAVGVTPDGKRIAVGDQSGCVHFLCLEMKS